ncbi:MAG: hypothetical protein EOM59_10810 [Clostridia bacterium]|nr:hypothetical protein [Clostridia bacterium]
MAEFKHIKPAFSSGELSPSMYPRVDLNRYSTGLRRCKNFFIHPHGGASNRSGTKYVATTKYPTKLSRVVKFVFSSTQAYTLEFGEEYVRFYQDHAQLALSTATAWATATDYEVGDYVTQTDVIYYCLTAHTSGVFATDLAADKWVAQTIYERPLPYQEEDLALLRFERSADVLYIYHPDYQTRTLSRYGATDWRVDYYAPEDGPFMAENVTTTTLALSAVSGTSVTMVASVSTFLSGHVDSLWKLTHYIPNATVSTAYTGTTTGTSIACFTTWRCVSHGTWTGKFKIQKSTNGGSTWTDLREFTGANDFNVNTYGTEDIETNPTPFLIRSSCHAFTSGTINVDLSADPYYQNGIVKVNTVANGTAANVTVLTVAGSTATTTSWAEGAWSAVRGYPSSGSFHQDRLCSAATDDEPMNVWMSQTGVYDSHHVHSTVLDTDAISIKLLSRQVNAVNGLAPIGDLVALTSASEWRIGADKTTLTPLTVFAKPQGYRGSSGLTPVIIGNQIIYVQSNDKVVRNFGYDYSVDSYQGVDLRILSEHLFSGHAIVDMDYQQDDDSIVWFVRDDGIFLPMTYMQEQDVIAWAWCETEGNVESVTIVPAVGYDELWMIVDRGGDLGRCVEYMTRRMESTDARDQYFLDCGLSYDNPITDITSITRANPAVITTTADHGLEDGDLVDITDCTGMTELNNRRFTVANKTDKTFELSGEDSTFHGTYVDGCKVRKAYTSFSGLSHLAGKTVSILGDGVVHDQQVVGYGDTYTKLLLHCDTSSFPDDLENSVFNNRVVLSTTTKKFGAGSGYFDGALSYLSVADSADWDFDDGDFTIEAWVRFTSLGKTHCIASQVEDINNCWAVYKDENEKLCMYFIDGGTVQADYITTNACSFSVNTWYHVAFIRSTTGALIFVNGVAQTLTETEAFSINDVGDMSAPLIIGNLF